MTTRLCNTGFDGMASEPGRGIIIATKTRSNPLQVTSSSHHGIHPVPGKSFTFLSAVIASAMLLAACGKDAPPAPPAAGPKPTLTVEAIRPEIQNWTHALKAGGNIVAWQETVIGPEISNYRIVEVSANVGDRVKSGQVLARIASETVAAELAEARATASEAEVTLIEKRADHERTLRLTDKGFYSTEKSVRSRAEADTAKARLDAAGARLRSAELKFARATVTAPDDGIISARDATVGALTQPGQELFRLIRGGRIEWRAEITAAELGRVKPGQTAALAAPDGQIITGRVRAVAPTVDPEKRLALVYVDLPPGAAASLGAGMFVRGEFILGQSPALSLPQAAVLQREGFAYVFRIDGNKVRETKVGTGRRLNERIEISGLDAGASVVASGVGFLADGDTVSIAAATSPRPAPAPAPAPAAR